MEAARPRTRGRRLRRGTVERPLNARLVRVGFLVVAPAVLAFLFSISTTGTLPRSPLEPLFDGANRGDARAIAVDRVSRRACPGSEGAAQATRWYSETIAALGLSSEEDVWTEDLADLGTRRVAQRRHRRSRPLRGDDRRRCSSRQRRTVANGIGDNASGTAALIELARGFAPQDVGPDPTPQHTLVLVSTDAGAYGGAGAERFATTSPLARSAIAAVVLDGLGGAGRPRLAIAGDEPVSPARPLVSTAAARVEEETRVTAGTSLRLDPARRSRDSVRRRRAGAVARARHRRRDAHRDGSGRLGGCRRQRRRGNRRRAARQARPSERGAARLARRQRGWRVPYARQPLLRRSRCERLDGAARARARGRSLRAGRLRPDRARTPSLAPVQTCAASAADAVRLLRSSRAHSCGSARSPACSRRVPRFRSHRSPMFSSEPPIVGLMLLSGTFAIVLAARPTPARAACRARRPRSGWPGSRRRSRALGLVALALALLEAVRAGLRSSVALRLALAPARGAARGSATVLFALGLLGPGRSRFWCSHTSSGFR